MHLVATTIPLLAAGEEAPGLLLRVEFAVRYAREIAADCAELLGTSCGFVLVSIDAGSAFQYALKEGSLQSFMLTGRKPFSL